MAIVIIPEKICPHCGGNKWAKSTEKGGKYIRYECAIKSRERHYKASKRYRNLNKKKCYEYTKKWKIKNWEYSNELNRKSRSKQIKNISDSYIKELVDYADITPTQIENYRLILKRRREYFKGINNLVDKKIENMNTNSVKSHKDNRTEMRKNELANLLSISTSDMSEGEKQRVYNRRYVLKKSLKSSLTLEDYNNLVAIGVEPTIQEKKDRPQIREKLSSIEVKPVEIENKPESIVEEFRKIEQRRNEILSQVSQFNEYVESLKIKL